jgi:predicted Fe-Mo cluster-binding NifX family protein
MRIAIAAQGADTNSLISQHAARAPFYLIFNAAGELQEAIKNPCSGAERGAGPKAAHFLAQQNIQMIVAGDFGGRFVEELDASGIQQLQKSGVASDAINEIVSR